MRYTTLWLLLLLHTAATAQKLPLKAAVARLRAGQAPVAADLGFEEHRIIDVYDTIALYTWHKPGVQPSSVYLTLPGTDATDIFTWYRETDSTYWFNALTSFDFSYLPDEYLLVIVAKPGFGFLGKNKSDNIPEKYWRFQSLDDRVYRADKALRYVKKKLIRRPEKVVVFGYSEGFYVGARLATVNKSVTHLGIGGGGGYIDFYDFILFNQQALYRGEQATDSVLYYNNQLIDDFKKIMENPSPEVFTYGYSNKRWASFAEPPINSLTRLDIPIFQIHGSDDESTPLEDAYIVPLEFARLRKNNLTFSVCAHCNHSLVKTNPDGVQTDQSNTIMREFFKWVDNNRK